MAYNIKNLAKYQQQAQRLHDRYLNKIDKSIETYALKQAAYVGFIPQLYNKKVTNQRWCPICGKVIADGTTKCPHCKAELGSPRTLPTDSDRLHGCTTYKDYFYFEQVTTCRGWQVVRMWLADFTFRKNSCMELTYLGVVFERWFNPTIGKEVLLGKYRGSFPYYRRIPWALSYMLPTEVFAHRTLQVNSYDERTELRYPRVRLLDYYKDKQTERLRDLDKSGTEFNTIFRLLNTKQSATIAETMLKVGTDSEIQMMLNHTSAFSKYWRTILISRRHGFDYAQYGKEYFDYLGQLERLHLDIHSPKYVAPTDFHAMHQQMTSRLNAIAERRWREEQRRREIERYEREKAKEEEFKKARGMYFGLMLVSEKYKAEPLKSIHDFLEEGLAMHHCVYSCGYYDTKQHPDSLILSVRSSETNERMVTIEISTKTWKICQCYAKHDSIHPQNRKIRKWINENMETIKGFSKPKRRATATS